MKNSAENKVTNKEDLAIDVFLMEYKILREAIQASQQRQEQAIILSLGSISVLIPIIFTQINNLPIQIIAFIFFLLALFYSGLSMYYCYWIFELFATSRYIHLYIEPQLRLLIESVSHYAGWETFIRKERSTVITFILSSVGPSASYVMILLPGIISLIIANYLMTMPIGATQSTGNAIEIINLLLTPLSIFALLAYVISTIIAIALPIYNIRKANYIEHI
jgi:hypothetical protein